MPSTLKSNWKIVRREIERIWGTVWCSQKQKNNRKNFTRRAESSPRFWMLFAPWTSFCVRVALKRNRDGAEHSLCQRGRIGQWATVHDASNFAFMYPSGPLSVSFSFHFTFHTQKIQMKNIPFFSLRYQLSNVMVIMWPHAIAGDTIFCGTNEANEAWGEEEKKNALPMALEMKIKTFQRIVTYAESANFVI